MIRTAPQGQLFVKEKARFSLQQTGEFLPRFLTRRQRNNGMGRGFLRVLEAKGNASITLASYQDKSTKFSAARDPESNKHYHLYLTGTSSTQALFHFDAVARRIMAKEESRRLRDERREQRRQGHFKPAPRPPSKRALAGASGRLKRHFKNSKITWFEATAVIAHAARMPRSIVHQCMIESLDDRGVATMRIHTYFVCRIDLGHTYYGNGMVEVLGPVELRTTNDNTQHVYRRLRNRLRKLKNKERRDVHETNLRDRLWRNQERFANAS